MRKVKKAYVVPAIKAPVKTKVAKAKRLPLQTIIDILKINQAKATHAYVVLFKGNEAVDERFVLTRTQGVVLFRLMEAHVNTVKTVWEAESVGEAKTSVKKGRKNAKK